MDSDSSATRLVSASRRHHFRSNLYHGEEDIDEELRPEFLCPFCAEDFDVVGLCIHMDEEHAIEAKSGVCPVCAKRVGLDLVAHFIDQHASVLKVRRKRRFRKGGSNLTLSLLKKELREGNLQSVVGGSSHLASSSNAEADPLLSSFMYNLPAVREPACSKHEAAVEESSAMSALVEESLERNVQQSPLSDEDQEEKARKCEFVQGLLLSTFLDDGL